jgi:hypothetical protein
VFERLGVFGFLLYFLIVGGSITLLIHVASQIADYAVATQSSATSGSPQSSRVAVGLEAQQRATTWQAVDSVSETPSEPQTSAAELAKSIDEAESHPLPVHGKSNELVPRPNVAGWSKRIDRNAAR